MEMSSSSPDLSAPSLADRSSLRVVFLGDCLAPFRLEILKKVAALRGLTLDGVASVVNDYDCLNYNSADLVILFPWTYGIQSPIWSLTAIENESARIERLEAVKDYLTTTIQSVVSAVTTSLVLVHGF